MQHEHLMQLQIRPSISEPRDDFRFVILCCGCPGQYQKAEEGMMNICEDEWLSTGSVTMMAGGDYVLSCEVGRLQAERITHTHTVRNLSHSRLKPVNINLN